MARAAGSSTRASPAATPSVDTTAPGSRRLAPTTSISTPFAVALASRPTATRRATPTHAATHRSRSIGLRMRRAL